MKRPPLAWLMQLVARRGGVPRKVVPVAVVLAAMVGLAFVDLSDVSTGEPGATATAAVLSSDRVGLAGVAGLGDPMTVHERAEARSVIDGLRVAGRGPRTGYSREAFGPAWSDDHSALWGRNRCDTRNDVLARDLDAVVFDGSGCVVLEGVFVDPYTGGERVFSRSNANAVHVDHVVALSLAWQMGAARWDEATRIEFANDPLNLVATDGPTNQAKSDSSAASWLPPHRPNRCAYVYRIALVSQRYGLAVTAADQAVMVAQCQDH